MNMDHERCSELLLPYVQGELDPETSGGVEEHLSACGDCRKEREGLAALFSEPIEPLNDLERAALHRDLRQRVSIPAGPPQEKAGLSWLPQALGVAALLLVVVIGFQYLGGSGSEDEAASSGGGSSTEDKANLAAPEGPEPVTLKLTSSGVRQAGAIAAGEGATAGFESSEEEDASDAPPESAEPEQPDALERQNDDSTGKLTTNTRASVESALKTYARTSPTFTRFAAAYRAEDVDDLTPTFIEELAEGAPESSAGQVTECAQLVVTSREFPTLPTAAAHGIFRKENSLLLGFVWTEQETGPLDNYVIYVWPVGSCSTPSHSQSGRIRTGG